MAREIKNSKTGTPSEAAKHLQNKVLEMKRDGLSLYQISKELNYSDTYIKKIYRQALKAIIVDNVEDVRKMELEKLDRLEREVIGVLRAFHPVVNSGSVVRDVVDDEDGSPMVDPKTGNPVTVRLQDQGPKLAAVDRAIRIMERRARLMGLDTPVKTQQEVRVTTEGPDLSHISVTELEEIKRKLYVKPTE
jgi:hypothetical protein